MAARGNLPWTETRAGVVRESSELAKRTGAPVPVLNPQQPLPVVSAVEPLSAAAGLRPLSWATSEREHIANRIATFKANQARVQREREDYYSRTMQQARDLAQGRSDDRS